MILEYSYDKANEIIELFKNSEIASLNITTFKDTDEPRFAMEYTLVKDCPETKQVLIRKALESSLTERLQLVNVLNQFLENQILNNVKSFTLKFNAINVRKCQITYSSSYKSALKSTSSVSDLQRNLEQLDRTIVEMGISDQTTVDIYKKEGSGRSKKYIPLTIGEVLQTLRASLAEE